MSQTMQIGFGSWISSAGGHKQIKVYDIVRAKSVRLSEKRQQSYVNQNETLRRWVDASPHQSSSRRGHSSAASAVSDLSSTKHS